MGKILVALTVFSTYTHAGVCLADVTSGHVSSNASNSDYIADLFPQWIDYWPASRMPIRIFIQSGENIPGYKSDFAEIFKQSCQDWASASKQKINFAFVDNAKDADIRVSWLTDKSLFVDATEGGDAQILPDQNGIKSAAVRLVIVPLINGSIELQIKAMSLHEMGHALGLQGHSKNSSDIMAANNNLKWNAQLADISLSQRDCNTIEHLYNDGCPAIKIRRQTTAKYVIDSSSNEAATTLNNAAVKDILAKDFPAAITKLHQVLQLDPNYKLAKSNLGIAYNNAALESESASDFPKAIDWLQQALWIEPNNQVVIKNLVSTYHTWANYYYHAEDYQNAVCMFKKALEYGQNLPTQSPLLTPQTIRWYIYCLRQVNQDNEADKWEARLKQIDIQ